MAAKENSYKNSLSRSDSFFMTPFVRKSIQSQEDLVIGNDNKIAGWQADLLEYYRASLP